MMLGKTLTQGHLLRSTVQICQGRVAEDSLSSVLHRERCDLFSGSMFAYLFMRVGRYSVPR